MNAAFVQNVMPYTYAVPLTVAEEVPAEKNSFAVPSVRSGATPPCQLPCVVSRPSPAAPVHTYVSPATTGAPLRTRSVPPPVMCSPIDVPSFLVYVPPSTYSSSTVAVLTSRTAPEAMSTLPASSNAKDTALGLMDARATLPPDVFAGNSNVPVPFAMSFERLACTAFVSKRK